MQQMSAVADGPAQLADSLASCCIQRLTLSVIKWPSSSVECFKYGQLVSDGVSTVMCLSC